MSYQQIQELHHKVIQAMHDNDGDEMKEIINPFQDFTAVFSRDEKIGLGMQIREYQGQIVVHAISCMNGTWLDSVYAVNQFIEISSMHDEETRKYSWEYDDDDHDDDASTLNFTDFDDMTTTLGPAGNAGILPGDCIIGIHGQCFHKSSSSSSSSLSLLTHASDIIRQSTDPIILHIRRYNTDPRLESQEKDHHLNRKEDIFEDTDTSSDEDDDSTVNKPHDKNQIHTFPKNKTPYHVSIKQDMDDNTLIQSSQAITTAMMTKIRGRWNHKEKKGANIYYSSHPFVRLLVEKGIIQRSEDESKVISELCKITERANLWESIKNEVPTTYPPSFENSMTTHSSPSSSSSSSHVLFYPARRAQSTILNNDVCMIQSAFFTINKALSIRIVDSFIDGDKLAYTIWVYDAEKGEEWYAPIRYTQDFVELRDVTSRMSKYVEKINFPSSGWFSTLTSTEVSESQSSRDTRCFRLETFLRELFKAIYLHPLTPISAEVALYVQSFLGVDSYKERLIHFSPNFHVTNNISIEEDYVRSQLQIAFQLYVYRIFLLGVMGRLVDAFTTDIRGCVESSTITRDLLENTLKKIKTFLHQTEMLLYDGCAHDFRNIMVHLESSIDIRKKEENHDEETLLHDAIRAQVEVEAYIPIRSLISKHLTTLWRDDDMEVLRKINMLKQFPQSYFIPQEYESPSEWKAVSQILTVGLARQSLPCIKLKSIVNAGLSIPRLFEIEHRPKEKKPFTADVILPIFIYAVVHADIDRPHALRALLRNLCDPSTEIGIEGYYLSTFEASVAHIMDSSL